ncbi:hypothetical protein ONZ45_g14829 [Pleurotus djamor]|nr:hypothetical protein ONZ45_g14829 [Pleurotus djamor]
MERCRSEDGGDRLHDSHKLANAVSIAACQDAQVSWEDKDGASLTSALITILKTDPKPTYHHIMTSLNHHFHSLLLQIHEAHKKAHDARGKRRKNRRKKKNSPVWEMDNFQDPQLSSHLPLDMGSTLSL